MTLERIWREKSDEEVAAAATSLSDYAEEAQRVIQDEVRRRGISEALTDPTDDSARDLPVNWLRFWIWFRLPVGAVVTPLLILAPTGPRSVMEPMEPIAAVIGLGLGVVIAVFLIVVAVGLHKRRLWAWKTNWGLIFGEAVLLPLTGANKATGPFEGIVLYIVLLGFAVAVWVLPNLVYFRKRRHMFI